jgi:hypothetical protein
VCVLEARVRGWRRSQAHLSPSCKLLVRQLLEMANFLNHVLGTVFSTFAGGWP